MEIREVNLMDYQGFLNKNPHQLFIHPDWLNLVVEPHLVIKYYGFFEDKQLVDVFPIVMQKGRLFSYITSPMFTPHLGTCSGVNQQELLKFLQKQRVANTSYPFYEEVSMVPSYQTFQLDLTNDLDTLWSNLRSDKKRNIKKATKEGLHVTYEKDTNLLFSLLEKTFARQKHSFNGYKTLERIIKQYSNIIQVNVWDGADCIASSLVVYNQQTAFYLIGGFDASKEKHYAGPFSLWTSILTCKERGIHIFDFEGSMIPSIATYFMSFGAQRKNYAVYTDEKWYFKILKTLSK